MTTGRHGTKSRYGKGPAVAALGAALLVPAGAGVASSAPADRAGAEAQAVSQLTRSTEWEQEARIPLDVDTFHPQA